MSIRSLVSRLLALPRRRAIDADLAEEIDEHLRIAVQAKMAAGLPFDAARDAARREFGNPTLVRESSREAWGCPGLDAYVVDLRFGLRMARKHRASTLVAIGSLGIAIGVTSAVVSLLGSVMHPTYAFTDPDRLAVFWARSTRTPRFAEMQISMRELRAWQHGTTQASVAGFTWAQSVNVSAGELPTRSSASLVTSDLLSVLGVAPMLGRRFTPDDERDDAPNAAIVTYDFWKEFLGGTAAALSTPLVIDRETYAVVGVMPPDFRMPILLKVKVLLPARRAPWISDPSARSILPIGRLAPGATIASVSHELERLTARFNDDAPEERNAWSVNVQPLRNVGREHVAKVLGIFLALTVVVLLIACANVAILLLARVPERRQELMVRLALGAERRRLVSQLVAESGLLAVGAAALGAMLVRPTMSVLFRLIDGSLSFELQPSLDAVAVLCPVLLAMATCFIVGIAPAVSAVRSVRDTGALAGVRTAGAVEQEWLRSTLMAAEVALSIVLIVGGWLMIESVFVVHRRALGFDARELVTARLLLDTTRYRSATAQSALYAGLAGRLRAHNELRDVTISSTVPLGTAGDLANYVTRDVESIGDKADTLMGSANVVMPDYFTAMHVPVVAGRMFDGHEGDSVVAVNEELARQLWPGRSAIGQRLHVLRPMFTDGEAVKAGDRRVVAVVGDVRPSPTHPLDAWPNFFLPYSQQPLRGMYIALRAPTAAAGASAIRAEVKALDPLLPVYGVKSIDELLDYWLSGVHLDAMIADVLAGVGILLTLIGIYSVVAVFVSQRTREIGIRIAVGAQRGHVVRMVLRRTIRPTAIGVAVGSGVALLGTRAMASLLHGVSPLEPRAFAGAVILLAVVVVSAALIPARRAARLDPIAALRAG